MVEGVRVWATERPDVAAVGLAGSWARDEARTSSDVDLVILTPDLRHYGENEAWARELGGTGITETRAWGPLTERRFSLASGLEVDAGFAPPSWAGTDPLDPGTRGVVGDGFRVVYDPEGLLSRLAEACR